MTGRVAHLVRRRTWRRAERMYRHSGGAAGPQAGFAMAGARGGDGEGVQLSSETAQCQALPSEKRWGIT